MRASDENLGHFTSSRSMSVRRYDEVLFMYTSFDQSQYSKLIVARICSRDFIHINEDKKCLQIEYKEPRKLWFVEFSTNIRKKKNVAQKMRLTLF